MSSPSESPAASPEPRTAVVTVAHGQHDQLALLHKSLSVGDHLPDLVVVVAIDDSKLISWAPERGVPIEVIPMSRTADGPPLAAAFNAGAVVGLAHGADVLVFLDQRCVADDKLVAALSDAVRRQPDALWCGVATRLDPPPEGGYDLETVIEGQFDTSPVGDADLTPAEVEPAAFAIGRETWASLSGFDEAHVGSAVLDLARRGHDAGLHLGAVDAARVWLQHGAERSGPSA